MLLTALPVGYIADKYSRSLVVAWGGVTNLLAQATLALAVIDPWTLGKDTNFYVLLVAMCLYGLGGGIVNGPAQALYAGR